MQIFLFLLPQLILFLVALLVLGIDLVDFKYKKTWLPYVALVGALLALGWSIYLIVGYPIPAQLVLDGMISIDAFALFFQVFASLVASIVIASAIGYPQDRTSHPAELYALILLASFAISLLAVAADLVLIFVAFELLSISSYIMTGYFRDDPIASEAAIKYFLYGAMASAIMLYGMSFLYGITNETNLQLVAQSLGEADASLRWLIFPSMILMMVGLGYKIAAVPFHQWSPDIYEGAPTPVTAFLSVGSIGGGFAVLMRILIVALPNFQMDWVALLTAMAMMTMTFGNVVALSQKNIKRMLAYSGIAQAGYMMVGLVSWDSGQSGSAFEGIGGLLFYLLAYLFANLGAFVVVIIYEQATGSNKIEDYSGLMERFPWLAAPMMIFLLSLIGIPGTGGFIGKLIVFGSAIRAEFYVLAIVAVTNSVIAGFYYLNVVRYMFFEAGTNESKVIKKEPSSATIVALVVTCAMTLLLGLYAQPFFRFVQNSLVLLSTM